MRRRLTLTGSTLRAREQSANWKTRGAK